MRYNEETGGFVKSSTYFLPITATSTASELKAALRRIVSRMVMLLQDHIAAVDAMTSAREASGVSA